MQPNIRGLKTKFLVPFLQSLERQWNHLPNWFLPKERLHVVCLAEVSVKRCELLSFSHGRFIECGLMIQLRVSCSLGLKLQFQCVKIYGCSFLHHKFMSLCQFQSLSNPSCEKQCYHKYVLSSAPSRPFVIILRQTRNSGIKY